MAFFIPNEVDFGSAEAPCEFCEELFPLALLIEHQTGCEPELTSLNLANIYHDQSSIPSPAVEAQVLGPTMPDSKIDKAIFSTEVHKLKSETVKQNKETGCEPELTSLNLANIYHDQSSISSPAVEAQVLGPTMTDSKIDKAIFSTEVHKLKSETVKQSKEIQIVKPQHVTEEEFKEKSETLLAFDSTQDHQKHIDKEYTDEILDKLDIENLSDEDCKETLEDFWKRADDVLKRVLK